MTPSKKKTDRLYEALPGCKHVYECHKCGSFTGDTDAILDHLIEPRPKYVRFFFVMLLAIPAALLLNLIDWIYPDL